MGVLGFDFGLYVSEICHFLCLSLMRSFVVHFFSIFQDIVWLVKSSWCVKCCSTHQVYWVSVWCSSGFALWCFFVRKVVTVLAVFLSFWSWLPDIPWVFINLKAELSFWGRNCLLTCLCYLGLSNFWFQFSLCGIMSFYVSMCLSVMRFFSWKVFPLFEHSVWLILSI